MSLAARVAGQLPLAVRYVLPWFSQRLKFPDGEWRPINASTQSLSLVGPRGCTFDGLGELVY